jgi:alkylhydroperoxidase/carboxymuconolactone decarboxylase family protein YurZ
MTQDATSGASIRQRVIGEANVQRRAPSDPFLAPFFETAIEHVWGGVWNRPGLELKYRSLVVVSALAAIGQNEELKTHLRGALNLGWTVDELREALLQMSAYAGFPAAHESLNVLSEIATHG